MLLTSMLMFVAMREVWGWSLWLSVLVAGVFVVVDLSFVTANMIKVVEGGWVPLLVGSVLLFLMSHLGNEGRKRQRVPLELLGERKAAAMPGRARRNAFPASPST